MAAVSVIVLVYNVRDYIAQCARSLFGQTLEDIEYIFVDDCSGDDSIEILEKILEEEFPERKGSVKILRNDRNRGQAWCRRLAVENAAGEYIIHCDSDDWPELDMYGKLYSKAKSENLDIVICRMRRVYPDHTEPYENKLGAEDLLGALIYGDIHHQLVDKLISRKAYEKGVIFPQANLCEDIPITIQLAYNSSSWGYLDETLYNYRFSPQSITAAPSSKATSAQVQSNIALTLSFLESKGLSRKYRKNIRHMKCWTRFTALPLPRKEYMAVYPEVNLAILLNSRFTVKERLGHLTKMLGIHGISKLFSKR